MLREQEAETYATQEYHLVKGGPQHGRQVPAISQSSPLTEESDQSINVQTHIRKKSLINKAQYMLSNTNKSKQNFRFKLYRK